MKLNKMAPEVQRSVLIQALRKEILKELNLSFFKEWRKLNSQGVLFYSISELMSVVIIVR